MENTNSLVKASVYIYIYPKLAPKLSATGPACSSVVEHWSGNTRGPRFDSQPEGLGIAFFIGPGLGLIMYIFTDTRISYTNFDMTLIRFIVRIS